MIEKPANGMVAVKPSLFAWFTKQAKAKVVPVGNGSNYLDKDNRLVAQLLDGKHYIKRRF